MTIKFSDEEKKWIIKDDFNWKLSKDCPDKLKKLLEKKLSLLNKSSYVYNN